MMKVCEISITNNVVDIIFHVCDENREGNLSSDEFVRVIQRRERNNSQPRANTKRLIDDHLKSYKSMQVFNTPLEDMLKNQIWCGVTESNAGHFDSLS